MEDGFQCRNRELDRFAKDRRLGNCNLFCWLRSFCSTQEVKSLR